MATWSNLLPGGSDFTGPSGSRPTLRVFAARDVPYIRYTASQNDRLEMSSPGFHVGSTNVTFGVVARASLNAALGNDAHLIGRWDGNSASTRQWRLVFDPDPSSAPLLRFQFSDGASLVEITAPAGEFIEPTMVIYRAATGAPAPYECG